MNNSLNLNSNNLNDSYIYQKLVDKINELEKQYTTVLSLIKNANNDLNISLKDYTTIMDAVRDRVTYDDFNKHTLDSEIHLTESKTLEGNDELNIDDDSLNKLKQELLTYINNSLNVIKNELINYIDESFNDAMESDY